MPAQLRRIEQEAQRGLRALEPAQEQADDWSVEADAFDGFVREEAAQSVGQARQLGGERPFAHDEGQMDAARQEQPAHDESEIAQAGDAFVWMEPLHVLEDRMIEAKVVSHGSAPLWTLIQQSYAGSLRFVLPPTESDR